MNAKPPEPESAAPLAQASSDFEAFIRRNQLRMDEAIAASGLTPDEFLQRQEMETAEAETKRRLAAFLIEENYPDRARESLATMHGPGLQKAKDLLPLVNKGDCILILAGDRGTGKTQIATWLASKQVEAGRTAGRYVKTLDLLSEVKAVFGTSKSESSVMARYKATRMLVLDEFQERRGEDWDSALLTNLIDHRYDKMLVTIIIVNISPEEISKRIPASIISRAEQTGGLVWCDWKSYRQQ